MRFALPLALLALTMPAHTRPQDPAPPDAAATPEQVEDEGEQALESKYATPREAWEREYGVRFQDTGKGRLGDRAEIAIPERFLFAGGDDTRKFLEANGNLTAGSELGMLAPETTDWFVVFSFTDEGYVEDDEKGDLDADEILGTIRENTAAGNEERRARGMEEFEVLGWATPPHYNDQTHNLEWATRLKAGESVVVNHKTKILGRKGVMSVVLVCNPDQLESLLPEYRTHLEGFTYVSGERYSEYTSGDKIAAYGLTALVAGGAGVLAVKTGFLAKFWKILAAGVVALGALVKKLFGGGSKTESGSSSS